MTVQRGLFFKALLTCAFLLSGCGEDKTAKNETTEATVYVDPNGYFKILPPVGWHMQEYPQEPRGKVAFLGPGKQIELRVLAKAAVIRDFDGLIKKGKDIEAQAGVPMNVEPVIFNEMPAVKRDITLEIQGVTLRFLVIDLLIDGVLHNLQFSAPQNAFDEHYETAWKSMQTYESLKLEEPLTPEEAREHEVAKWRRVAAIALEMGNVQLAKDAVSEGLKADPDDTELLELKLELDNR